MISKFSVVVLLAALLARSTTFASPLAKRQACAGALSQCGGKVYTGPTCCETGYTCEVVSEWYSQCREGAPASAAATKWVATWLGSPQLTENQNNPPMSLSGATLRQYIHVSLGGPKIRLTISNQYSNSAVSITKIHVAKTVNNVAGDGRIDAGTSTPLTFSGSESVTIQQGQRVTSDPLEFAVDDLSNLAITAFIRQSPSGITGHPGSRTTSLMVSGDSVTSANMGNAQKTDHWYFIAGLDVMAPESAYAIATLGDSLTDGRGSITNQNNRWPDLLAERVVPELGLSVINAGVGGGTLTSGGLGVAGVRRLDDDVINQAGIKYLMVFIGINEIQGGNANGIINGMKDVIRRSKAAGIKVFGCTLMPVKGNGYFSGENTRQQVNQFIRTGGEFDAVIDFDKTAQNPNDPQALSSAADGGDHLHLSVAGYQMLADSVDLTLFN